MKKRGIPLLDDAEDRAMVRQHFKQAGLGLDILEQLIDIELNHMGKDRRRGINEDIGEVLSQVVAEGE